MPIGNLGNPRNARLNPTQALALRVCEVNVKEKPSRLACAPSQRVEVANGPPALLISEEIPKSLKNLCNHFLKSM